MARRPVRFGAPARPRPTGRNQSQHLGITHLPNSHVTAPRTSRSTTPLPTPRRRRASPRAGAAFFDFVAADPGRQSGAPPPAHGSLILSRGVSSLRFSDAGKREVSPGPPRFFGDCPTRTVPVHDSSLVRGSDSSGSSRPSACSLASRREEPPCLTTTRSDPPASPGEVVSRFSSCRKADRQRPPPPHQADGLATLTG